MAYLVLARKYRPQGFSDMTGQEHVVQTLSNAMKSGRVAHALLFCGPRGCGKTTTARIVAKALNCEKGPTPNPCGECSACREITAGTDVDVQEIDAASNTGVDNVRELRESAKYLPARDRYKIFIVDEVHMLSKAAFNAFLKTLEEPPGHVKFLFATTDPQALPDTILSRCQRHNFRLVPLKQIVERIRSIARAENVTIDDGAVALVARQAAGSMRDALSILDQLFSSCGLQAAITEADAVRALGALDRTVVSDLASALIARDPKGVLTGVSRAFDGGHDLKRLAEDLATHLRNLVAAGVSGAPLDLPDHELRALREQASGTDGAELARLFELVHGALFELSRAAQPRHALEIALLRAVHLSPGASVQALLLRTEALAKKLGSDGLPPAGGGGGGGGGRPRFSEAGPAPVQEAPRAEPVRASPPPVAAAPISSASPPAAVRADAVVDTPPVVHRPAPAPEAAPLPAPVREVPKYEAPAAAPPPEAPPRQAPRFDAAPAPSAPVAAPRVDAPRPAAAALKPWERHLGAEGTVPVATAAPAPVANAAPEVPAPAPKPIVVAPPAPVAPPVAVAPVDERWAGIVDQVRARKKMLGVSLEHARVLTLGPAEVQLGFLPNEIYLQNINSEKNMLEGILAEVMGGPVIVKIVELTAAEGARTTSLAATADRAEREAKDVRMKAGRDHPGILRAVAMLGAEIEDVRDLGGMSA